MGSSDISGHIRNEARSPFLEASTHTCCEDLELLLLGLDSSMTGLLLRHGNDPAQTWDTIKDWPNVA